MATASKETRQTKKGRFIFRDSVAEKFHYHGDKEKTRKAYRGDWFTLGDIGYTDETGFFLFLTDRQSNMIISGGVNIYPQEAEKLFAVTSQRIRCGRCFGYTRRRHGRTSPKRW